MRISDWSSDVCSSDLFPDKVDTANRREHKHVEPDHSAPKAGNRRPIAARGNVLVQRFSAWLARTGVSPNLISMMSIVFAALGAAALLELRSEEHTSELQSLMRISYAVFCLKQKNTNY